MFWVYLADLYQPRSASGGEEKPTIPRLRGGLVGLSAQTTMTPSAQNPYQSPPESTSRLPYAVPTTRQKYLRRYARCFWISVAIVVCGFSLAASARLFDPRVQLGQALLALAFFPYYIPILCGVICAIIFGGLWVATWFGPDSAHYDVGGRAQAGMLELADLPKPSLEENPGRPLTWRQRVLICVVTGAIIICFFGLWLLESIVGANLRRLPTLGLAGVVFVVALLVLMARLFRSKPDAQNHS